MSVRQLGPEERELYRTIRLRALRDSPTAFGSTYEREAAFDETVWETRLAPGGRPTLVYQDDHGGLDPVGLVVASPDSEDSEVVDLLSMWVAPEARGHGIGGELVQTVVRWAEHRGAHKVRLHITEGNTAAAALYTKYGFEPSGVTFVRERDGMTEIEMDLDLASP
jgi:GNAT superfamily N-acetyltransferase